MATMRLTLLVVHALLTTALQPSAPSALGQARSLSLRGGEHAGRSFLSQGNNATGPKDATFFDKDAIRMDELPPYSLAPKKKCHPKCTWDCGTPCQETCQAFCEAPKCETRCKEVDMSKCKRRCLTEPQCTIICPPQCEHGDCPECQTVCNKPDCPLDCGPSQCENVCADPVCTWKCQPDPKCEAHCKLRCEDAKICGFDHANDGPELPNEHLTAALGWEVAWKGFGKVPAEHMEELKAYTPEAPLGWPGGALPPHIARYDPPPSSPTITAPPAAQLVVPVNMTATQVPREGAYLPDGALPAEVAGYANGPQPWGPAS
mmetsp:Transcript_30363/g.69880  ORF Transcript_30363/g.69880 Transcript_30363/m.69880 type:complete len:318 (-) Transcript_30363:169-1122(-)